MKKILVACYVSLADAVATKSTRYGGCTVELTSLDGLSDGALALVAAACEGIGEVDVLRVSPSTLSVTEPTEAALRVALEARAAESAAAAAKDVERREKLILAALAVPSADWLSTGDERYYEGAGGTLSEHHSGVVVSRPRMREPESEGTLWVGKVGYLSPSALEDPRVVARRAEAERDLVDAVAAWEAQYAEWQRRVAAREAREADERKVEELKAAEIAAKVLTYVLACAPEWKRAARDGRDVTEVGAQHAADCVKYAIDFTSGDFAMEWAEREPREVPRTFAYQVLDELRIDVADVIADFPEELRALVGEPTFSIDRLTLHPEDEDDERDEVLRDRRHGRD